MVNAACSVSSRDRSHSPFYRAAVRGSVCWPRVVCVRATGLLVGGRTKCLLSVVQTVTPPSTASNRLVA